MNRRVENLVESKPRRIALTAEQAQALADAGVRLASDSTWWGQSEDEPERSVIECAPVSDGEWSVRVHDAVGVIVVGDLQLVVHPKIPLSHLVHLFEIGGYVPRVKSQLGLADAAASLWRLVAEWFISAAEGVLRRDLVRDYRDERDELVAVRGRMNSLSTARAYYSGRLRFDCMFDEFDLDTPLNRVLRSAAQVVAASPILREDLRRRARGIAARMENVGVFEVTDLRASTDRRSRHYREAFGWARHVLLARGRTLSAGRESVWTFLIRTPGAVEEGVRAILQSRFGAASIQKRGLRLAGSRLTVNPDLVVADGAAVADVKYKLTGLEWSRPDLYQLVTFAAAFRARNGAVISFCPSGTSELSRLQVGEISVEHLPWPADSSLSGEQAAGIFAERAGTWLRPLLVQ